MKKRILILSILLLSYINSIAQIDYTKEVGSTAGNFEVNLTGAATYQIPIYAPPGAAGMQPNISLVYSSQSGSDYLGVGWGISGISVVSRVQQNHYFEGKTQRLMYDYTDGFALDGQRLIRIAGDENSDSIEYRTENESFARIFSFPFGGDKSVKSPAKFLVYTKDGKIMHYNKRKLNPGMVQAFCWYIDFITDEDGNYMTFEYDDKYNQGSYNESADGLRVYNGDFRLMEIKYTGNTKTGLAPYNKIKFEYGTLTNTPIYGFNNMLFKNSSFLRRVVSYSENKEVRTHTLEYSENLHKTQYFLNKVTESLGDKAYNSTVFTWETTPNPEKHIESSFGVGISDFSRTETNPDGDKPIDRLVGDINGDGLSDIVSFKDGKIHKIGLALGRGFTIINQDDIELDDQILLDIDGDGNDELVGVVHKKRILDLVFDYTRVVVFKYNETTNKFDFQKEWLKLTDKLSTFKGEYSSSQDKIQFADMDGDALPDLILFTLSKIQVYRNTGSLFQRSFDTGPMAINPPRQPCLFGDLDGDGLPDLHFFAGSDVYVYLSKGTFFAGEGSRLNGYFTWDEGWDPKINEIKMVDVNADGLTDIVGFKDGRIQVSLSDGIEYKKPVDWGTINKPEEDKTAARYPAHFIDVNSDGFPDIVYFGYDGIYVYINNGSQFILKGKENEDFGYNGGWEEGRYCRTFGDFNGDGVIDIIGFGHGGTPIIYGVPNHYKKIIKVDNGAGNTTEIAYKYQRNTSQMSYPYTTKIAPALLVDKVTHSALHIGEYAKIKYTFQEPLTHLKGRGFLGFRKIITEDLKQLIKTEKKFEQKFVRDGYLGLLPVSEEVQYADRESDFLAFDYAIIQYSGKHFWIRKTSETRTSEFSQKKEITSFSYDYDGNLTQHHKYLYATISQAEPSQRENSYTTYKNVGIWNFKPSAVEFTRNIPNVGVHSTRKSYTYTGTKATSSFEAYIGDVFREEFSYDVFGNLRTKKVTGNNSQLSFETYKYDPKGRFLVEKMYGGMASQSYAYNSNGNLTEETDISGLKVRNEYDSWGNLAKTINPDGTYVAQKLYWAQNSKIPKAIYYKEIRATAQAPVYVFYDALGREVCTYTYSDISGAENTYVDTRYNTSGLVQKKSLPYSRIDKTDQEKKWIDYNYNYRKQLMEEIGPQLHKRHFYNYDGGNYTQTTVDVLNGNANYSKEYNAMGQMTKSTDPGGTISYTYNAQNLPLTITSGALTTTMTYDHWGNRTSITEPNSGTTTSEYNLKGQLEKQTDANGNYTTFGYDMLGRMGAKLVNGDINAQGSATYHYKEFLTVGGDQNGYNKLETIKAPNHNTNFTYDVYGRVIEKTETIHGNKYTTQYLYDYKNGQLEKIIYPVTDFYVTYEYDQFGELKRVKDNSGATLWTLDEKNVFGQTTAYSWGNNQITKLAYDESGNLTHIRTGTKSATSGELIPPPYIELPPDFELPPIVIPSLLMGTEGPTTGPGISDRNNAFTDYYYYCRGEIQDWEYKYNTQGLLEKAHCRKTDQHENYTYDNLHRLKTITGTTNYSMDYNLDGNIIQNSALGSYSRYANKPNGVSTVIPSGTGFSSDVTCQTTYTPFNKISKITEGINILEFSYGNDQQRIRTMAERTIKLTKEKKTIIFVNNLYEQEKEETQKLIGSIGYFQLTPPKYQNRHYIMAAGKLIGIHTGHKMYYVHTDRLGSYHVITDANGSVVERLSYDAWGNRRADSNWNHYEAAGTKHFFTRGYTGHEHLDAFHIINMNGRLYDPIVARFFSPDPYVANAGFTQDFNRYSYARNNPLMYTDPSGEFIWTIINGVKDFLRNTFVKVWTQGFNAWTDADNWHSTKMAWKIDMGLFQGDFKQIVSRFTWELPQTLLGYTVSGVHNTFDGVKSVTYYGGATAVESYSENWGGFTLGSYINGHRGLQADPNNSLFQHEYGHYLQSQSSGLFYLQRYALPSLIDAMGDSDHNYHAVEQDANIRAYKYFMENEPGFNIRDDKGVFNNGRWWQGSNPIKDYNWSLDYNNAANLLVLKKGLVYPNWWDYVLGPTIVIPGIINVLNLKQ